MGFMDDVSAFTKGIGQKAKGNYDIVAMNSQISSLLKEINGIYLKIGEQYYNIYRENPVAEVKEYVEKIKNLEVRIAETKQQIESTKIATAAVSLKATAVADMTQKQGENGFCAECGAPLSADAMFCVKCGTKVISNDTLEEIAE